MSDYDNAAAAYDMHQTVQSERSSGIVDPLYVKGIPGIMKYVQMGLCLIAYICVEASGYVCVPWVATTGFFKFITMFCFTTTAIYYALCVLKLKQRIFKCDCINWPLSEFVYYCAMVVCLFFGSLFMALHGCVAAHRAGTAFGFFALFAFIGDMVMSFRVFWTARKERSTQSTTQLESPASEPRY